MSRRKKKSHFGARRTRGAKRIKSYHVSRGGIRL